MRPTKAQMKKVEEVSKEEDGSFYYLKPGWRSRPGEHVHHILDAYNDYDYDPINDARQQLKGVVPCDCDDCKRLMA